MFHDWERFYFQVENANRDIFDRPAQKCSRCGAVVPLPNPPSPAICVMWDVDPDCSIESVKGVMDS